MNKKIFNGMKNIKKNLHKIVLAAFVFVWPVVSFAQNGTNPTGSGNGTNPTPTTGSVNIVNPIHATNITTLIYDVLTGVIKIGMPILVLAIIYSGFLFVAAQGNEEKLSTAKTSLLYTLIGAAILLGSWGLANLIVTTVKAL